MGHKQHVFVIVFDFVINTLLTVVELVASALSGSIAVQGDAFQNLTDSLVLTIAYVGEKHAARPHVSRKDIRAIYARVRLINALILVCLSVYVGHAALLKLLNPQPVNGRLVVAIGVLSVIVNFCAAGMLYAYRRDRVTEAPYVGLLFSGLSGLGVCAAGIGSVYWNVQRIDGAIGVAIACMLCIRSVRMLVSQPAHSQVLNT